jgi:hypothetical protein
MSRVQGLVRLHKIKKFRNIRNSLANRECVKNLSIVEKGIIELMFGKLC